MWGGGACHLHAEVIVLRGNPLANPTQLRIRDLPPIEAGVHGLNGFAVIALVRQVESRFGERKLIATEDGSLTAGTPAALRALGLRPSDLGSGSVSVTDGELTP